MARPSKLLLGFILCSSAFAKIAQAAPPTPNLVIILMDDMGYGDIRPFNPACRNRTPNLDRMAREGMKLTSFYAAPLCTPSRAQLLTGCYAKRVSLPQVIFPAAKIGLSADEYTIAGLLKQQGYATMAIGKWHVGDQPEFLPTHRGFDHYLGLPYSNDMGGEWDGEPNPTVKNPKPPLPLVRDERVIETVRGAQQDVLTERYTDEAVKFIRAHQAGPFFLYLPHTAVHIPLHPGKDFRGKSANGTYGDWVEEADASTGRVLDVIRELKLENNTLVLFSSDNGPWLMQGKDAGNAGPLRGGKGGTYEGGIREPTIAWWPGHVVPGAACDAVAGNIDLLPTFVKLAGGIVPTDRKIDGADISPLILGESKESPREAHYYFQDNRLEAVRSGQWKLAIAPQKEQTGKKPPTVTGKGPFVPKLYDLQADIGETTDVAAGHPDVVKRLQEFVAKMDADLGAKGLGPGVRPPGRVENPRPLLLEK